MDQSHFDIPVAFFVFNRPNHTRQTFRAIGDLKPRKLLVVADGPRANREGENRLCEEVRSIVAGVDWDCEVLTNFSDINLGCKERVASGLDWVFRNVDRAIILEDDCLPDPTFFRFCDEMLHRYEDDERVMMVSGVNFQEQNWDSSDSYGFSRFCNIWGWATWRRAWGHYDVSLKNWPDFNQRRGLRTALSSNKGVRYWERVFQRVYEGNIDTWDYQWTFAVWSQSGLSVVPRVNLVTNIGYGNDATHTQSNNSFAERPTHPLSFPLRHPSFVIPRLRDDEAHQKNLDSLGRKVFHRLRHVVLSTARHLARKQ